MASSNGDNQLLLPAAREAEEPRIADAASTLRGRVDLRHKLPSELTDAELLTAVLGPASNLPCQRLTTMYDSFRMIASLPAVELSEHGFSTGAINRLSAVFEIAKRYGEHEWKIGEPLRGSGDVYAHFRERLAAETCELFYCILLDNKHRKIREVLVSKGSLSASIVHPREVFAPVVRFSAAAIVLVHNHPSGAPEPSKEDIEITQRLRSVGELMGVRVLDHIIIGKGRYCSFVDDGYW